MSETEVEDRLRDVLRAETAGVVADERLDARVDARRAALDRTRRTRQLLAVAAATVVIAGAVALVATRGDDPERRDVRTVDTTPVPAEDAVLQVVISNERSNDEVSEEGELLRWALLDPAGEIVAQGPVGDGTTGILPGAKVAVGRHRFVVESYPCVEFCPEQAPSGRPVPNQPGGIGGTADPAEPLCDEPVVVTTSGSRLVYEITVTGDGCEGELRGRPAGGLVQEGWTRLPDPPLEPRFGSISAWSGPEIFVIGGSTALCPPNADCAVPPGTFFADGAAYNTATGSWRPIADAPRPLAHRQAVVLDGDLYLLEPFCAGGDCTDGPDMRLLRYDTRADRWHVLGGPPTVDGATLVADQLVATADGLLAYAASDEAGEVPDWRWSAEDGWVRLPDDPLPRVFDRTASIKGDTLYLLGTPIDLIDGQAPKLGARLDLVTGTWTSLPTAPGGGYQAWLVDDSVVLNPHFGAGAGGGVFDTTTDTWAGLPSVPASDWNGDMAGVLGRDTATFTSATGWALDVAAGSWVEIPPVEAGISDSSLTTVGRGVFQYGGQRWQGNDGELLGQAWLWQAPR